MNCSKWIKLGLTLAMFAATPPFGTQAQDKAPDKPADKPSDTAATPAPKEESSVTDAFDQNRVANDPLQGDRRNDPHQK